MSERDSRGQELPNQRLHTEDASGNKEDFLDDDEERGGCITGSGTKARSWFPSHCYR